MASAGYDHDSSLSPKGTDDREIEGDAAREQREGSAMLADTPHPRPSDSSDVDGRQAPRARGDVKGVLVLYSSL